MDFSPAAAKCLESNTRSANKSFEGFAGGFLEYIVILLLVLSYNTIWTRTPDLYPFANWIKLGACLIAFIIPMWHMVGRPYTKVSVGYFIIAGLGFCVSYFMGHNLESSLIAFLPVLLGLAYADSICDVRRLTTFIKRFINIACVLAAISLFFFILGSLLSIIRPTGLVSFNWETDRVTRSFYSLYYEAQAINFFGYAGVRNTGVFTEAPMFNFVLCLALISNALLIKGNEFKSILLIATIISTFSTTGYFVVALVALASVLHTKSVSKFISVIKFISIPLVVVFGLYALFLLFGDKSDTGSYGVRSDHLFGCINLFFSTFPFGTGFGNDDAYYQVFQYDQGVSIGVMYLLAQGGVCSLILYFGPTVSALISSVRAFDLSYFLLQVAFFWIAFLSQVITQPVFWIFVFLVLAKYPRMISDFHKAA